MPIGETRAIELIARIARTRNPEIIRGIGDDAALYRDGLVVTTDAYLEGVHFDRSYLELSAVGARAVCGTLSDIAAMCARPIGVYVSLMVPPGITRRDLRELYQGMDAVCSVYDTGIAGGDIISSPLEARVAGATGPAGGRLGLALTALGRTRTPRLRRDCRPGDYVFVTGRVALAETGRLALKHGLDHRKYRHAVERHVCPMPRIREALRLAPRIHGLIDTSDGLSTDAGHLADESRVRITVDRAALPVAPETVALCSELGLDLGHFLVSSGEDYELLFTSPHSSFVIRHSSFASRHSSLTRIGRVERGSGVWLLSKGKLRRLRPSGYDHLRPKRASSKY